MNIEKMVEFADMCVDFTSMVKVNKIRVTINRNWVLKTELEEFVGMSVEEFIEDIYKSLNDAIINVSVNGTNKGTKMENGKKINWSTAKVVGKYVKHDEKGGVLYEHTILEKGVQMDINAYEGTCYNKMCVAGDLGETIAAYQSGMKWDEINSTSSEMVKLNRKAGLVYNALVKAFPTIDINYVNPNAKEYTGNTKFSDTYEFIFKAVKQLQFTKEDGTVYTFNDWIAEVEAAGNLKGYRKYSVMHAAIISKFWDAKRENNKAWQKHNKHIDSYVAEYVMEELDEDAGLGDKMSAIWNGINEEFDAAHTVDVDYVYTAGATKGEPVCSCCGGKVYTHSSGRTAHLGVKKWEVAREFSQWTNIDPKTGIRYIFKNGEFVNSQVNVEKMDETNFDKLMVDLETMDIEYGTPEVEVEFDIDSIDDLDITMDMVINDIAVDAEDIAGMSIDTPNVTEDDEQSEYSLLMEEHWAEYDARYNPIANRSGMDAVNNNLFNKYLGQMRFDKNEYKEIEESYSRSVWFTLEDDIQSER